MTRTIFRTFIALGATTALAASLAACGPDDAQQNHTLAPLLTQSPAQPGWSMTDLAGVDPAFLQANTAPLPQAVPMRAGYRGDYARAPAFDYGPQPQYDDGYYADDVGPNDYQWLALASSLGGMLGAAPPDYGFRYGDVQPWAWETGDRYVRYAEPIDGGYRYYYYQPDSYTPYFVSDPYYSYGYRDDRLVAIYDNSGRVIDARRAERQRRAAQDYFARARAMYAAAHDEPRFGVAAPLWDRQRAQIVRQQQQMQQARQQRAAWQRWDAANQQRLHRDWASEALVRREAENRFAGWQQADFRTPAPQFYNQQQRQAQLQRLAAIRQQERQVAVQRAQVQAMIGQRQAQQQAAQHQQAIAQRQLAQQQRVAQQQLAQQQRQQAHLQQVAAQQQAQRAAQQQQQVQAQVQAQAEQAKAQRQAQLQRQQAQQQQVRHAAEQRQQVARQQEQQQQKRVAQLQEQQRQQQAQRAARQHQAQQARVEQQQKQAQARQAAQRQAQQQRVAEQQKQAQQARAAQQQKQAQQAQAARQQHKQAQQAQAAKQQAEAAKQQKQAQQAQAAKQQRQAEQSQAAPGNGGHGHGKGHERG